MTNVIIIYEQSEMMLCVLRLDLDGCKLLAFTALPVIGFLLQPPVNVQVTVLFLVNTILLGITNLDGFNTPLQ